MTCRLGTNHKLKRARNTHNLAARTDEPRNPGEHHSDSLHAKGVELFFDKVKKIRPCSCALNLTPWLSRNVSLPGTILQSTALSLVGMQTRPSEGPSSMQANTTHLLLQWKLLQSTVYSTYMQTSLYMSTNSGMHTDSSSSPTVFYLW